MVALSVHVQQGGVGFRVRAVSAFWEVECFVLEIDDMLVGFDGYAESIIFEYFADVFLDFLCLPWRGIGHS